MIGGEGCPAGQGQTRARRVCWLNVLSGAEGRAGVGVGSPAGQTHEVRLVDEWFGVNCLVESESKGGALGGWLGVKHPIFGGWFRGGG